MKEFYRKDLDGVVLAQKAYDESTEIYSKPSTAKGRSLEEIFKVSLYSLSAEQYLIEKCGFKDDARKYKDVISPWGNPVEVKVTEGQYYVYHVLKRCGEDKLQTWRNYPDWVFIYTNNKVNDHYVLHNTYKWNGKRFAPCDFDNDRYLEEDRKFLESWENA